MPFCRDFVLSQYQHLKKANPKFPILIRECSGAEARLFARYGGNTVLTCMPVTTCSVTATKYFYADFGVEQSVSINGLDSNAISSKLEDLVKKGESMPRFDYFKRCMSRHDESCSAASSNVNMSEATCKFLTHSQM